MGTYQGAGSSEHLQDYRDEFVFRCNRRRSPSGGVLFWRLLERGVAAGLVCYRDLVRVPVVKLVRPGGVTGPRARPGSLHIRIGSRPWRGTSR